MTPAGLGVVFSPYPVFPLRIELSPSGGVEAGSGGRNTAPRALFIPIVHVCCSPIQRTRVNSSAGANNLPRLCQDHKFLLATSTDDRELESILTDGWREREKKNNGKVERLEVVKLSNDTSSRFRSKKSEWRVLLSIGSERYPVDGPAGEGALVPGTDRCDGGGCSTWPDRQEGR